MMDRRYLIEENYEIRKNFEIKNFEMKDYEEK